jgi:ribosome maturation factor RimP
MVSADLESLVEESISKLGAHLIDLSIKTEGQTKSVELFIDCEEGITTELCSAVSRQIDGMIESSGVVRGSYKLTVSSPGISRPLKFPWQFKKHIGRLLDLKLRSGEGTEMVTGTLGSANGNEIIVTSGKQQQVIAYDTIQEACVRAPW